MKSHPTGELSGVLLATGETDRAISAIASGGGVGADQSQAADCPEQIIILSVAPPAAISEWEVNKDVGAALWLIWH